MKGYLISIGVIPIAHSLPSAVPVAQQQSGSYVHHRPVLPGRRHRPIPKKSTRLADSETEGCPHFWDTAFSPLTFVDRCWFCVPFWRDLLFIGDIECYMHPLMGKTAQNWKGFSGPPPCQWVMTVWFKQPSNRITTSHEARHPCSSALARLSFLKWNLWPPK